MFGGLLLEPGAPEEDVGKKQNVSVNWLLCAAFSDTLQEREGLRQELFVSLEAKVEKKKLGALED